MGEGEATNSARDEWSLKRLAREAQLWLQLRGKGRAPGAGLVAIRASSPRVGSPRCRGRGSEGEALGAGVGWHGERHGTSRNGGRRGWQRGAEDGARRAAAAYAAPRRAPMRGCDGQPNTGSQGAAPGSQRHRERRLERPLAGDNRGLWTSGRGSHTLCLHPHLQNGGEAGPSSRFPRPEALRILPDAQKAGNEH